MRMHLTIALAAALLVGALTPAAVIAGRVTTTDRAAHAVRVNAHDHCILNCVPHRGTLTEIARAMKDYHYGPRMITHWVEGKVFYFKFAHRRVLGARHKVAIPHIRAKTFPPPNAASLTPNLSQRRRDDCWWNMFDSACFGWTWPKVWDTVTHGNTLLHNVRECALGTIGGFRGNLTKAEAGTLLFYSIGTDLTEVPFFFKATPSSLALALIGHCVWGIYRDR